MFQVFGLDNAIWAARISSRFWSMGWTHVFCVFMFDNTYIFGIKYVLLHSSKYVSDHKYILKKKKKIYVYLISDALIHSSNKSLSKYALIHSVFMCIDISLKDQEKKI